jgi:hypothetical protein
VAKRPRHLERGWCWGADEDGDLWGIVGHLDDAEAQAVVDAYEGESVEGLTFRQDFRRSVPCRGSCEYGDCGGTHRVPADGPGRGVVAHTWASR